MSASDHALNTRFRFIVTGQRSLTLRLQKVPLAPRTLGVTVMNTRDGILNLPSNKIEYMPMVLEYIVSEDYREYFDILDWMDACKDNDEFQSVEERADLELLDSDYNTRGRFVYECVFPSEVGELTYETDSDATILKGTVTVYFSSMSRERL